MNGAIKNIIEEQRGKRMDGWGGGAQRRNRRREDREVGGNGES